MIFYIRKPILVISCNFAPENAKKHSLVVGLFMATIGLFMATIGLFMATIKVIVEQKLYFWMLHKL